MDVHKEIDTRGLNCPLPILKAKKALSDMASGQLLKVVATDGGSLRDFQAFAKQTGNALVDHPDVALGFGTGAVGRGELGRGLPFLAGLERKRHLGGRRVWQCLSLEQWCVGHFQRQYTELVEWCVGVGPV